MKKYIAPGLVILAGVAFIVVTFAQNLFAVGNDFEEMITDFRPALQDEVIATYRADIAGLSAVADEFQTGVLPGLAQALQQSPEELGGLLASQFPAVARVWRCSRRRVRSSPASSTHWRTSRRTSLRPMRSRLPSSWRRPCLGDS